MKRQQAPGRSQDLFPHVQQVAVSQQPCPPFARCSALQQLAPQCSAIKLGHQQQLGHALVWVLVTLTATTSMANVGALASGTQVGC